VDIHGRLPHCGNVIVEQLAKVARAMVELLRTNDSVLLNFVEVLLRDAGLAVMVADQNMSVLEGSLGVLPRRLLVGEDDEVEAKRIMEEAGLAGWIKTDDGPF
jgi:hypothetical protein